MVKVDEAFQVRYKFSGETFEVLVDFDKLEEFKKNNELTLEEVLADDKIFKDQKKGEIASENILNKIFDNKSKDEIIKEILLKGECQIPTAYLNKLREEKKKQIINYISEQAFNPQTKTKYTPSMIQSALEKVKISIDPLKDFIYQAQEILKDLKKEIPISISKKLMIIKIPGMHCGNFYGPFRKLGQIKKELFDNHGDLHIHFEISEVDIDKVANYIKDNSNGEGEYHIEE